MPENIENYMQNTKDAEKALISVIVPIYNLEEYLDSCIQSLVTQTYERVEILLVDDGSTDSSGKICKRWQERDSRIKYIYKENGGAASARNAALDVCTGTIVTFVDGDDYVDSNYMEVLYSAMVDNQADISICGWKDEYEFTVSTPVRPKRTITYTKTEAMNKLLYQEDFDTAMWAKLYRAELFRNIRFPEGNIYEDIAIIYKVFELCQKVVYSDYEGYHYLLRNTGTTLKKFSKKKMDLIDVVEEMDEYIRENCPEVCSAMESKFVRANFHIYLQIPRDKEFAVERKRIESNINKYRRNVLKDARTRRGTKIALILSGFSYGLFYRLKSLKRLGK